MSDKDEDTPHEYIRKYCEACYKLPYYDRQSLYEIERMLKDKEYKDKETAEQHLAYLEHLSDKTKEILSSEKRQGLNNLELEEDLRKMDSVFRQLLSLKSSLPKAPSYY
ncbi:hypothetical protein JW968_05515 [Candidatus Woesearchaeota archaeon]|nr:hypothetical protein [Candidatus Woesearchaeota archaeon]